MRAIKKEKALLLLTVDDDSEEEVDEEEVGSDDYDNKAFAEEYNFLKEMFGSDVDSKVVRYI